MRDVHYGHTERIDLPDADDDPVERMFQEKITGTTTSGWRAYCQCGWRGPMRDAQLTADNDARRHEARVRGHGPYA